jgi:hypothetical protein
MVQRWQRFVPAGSKGHIDFGELYPYNPGKARACRKRLAMMSLTYRSGASLPYVAATHRVVAAHESAHIIILDPTLE